MTVFDDVWRGLAKDKKRCRKSSFYALNFRGKRFGGHRIDVGCLRSDC